jgi:hypothetical protein
LELLLKVDGLLRRPDIIDHLPLLLTKRAAIGVRILQILDLCPGIGF